MLRLVSDEDVHNEIIRGLRRREPTLDIVRAVDLGLDHTRDQSSWRGRPARGGFSSLEI